MSQNDNILKPVGGNPLARPASTKLENSSTDFEMDDCIEALLESSKVYRNTGKIISKFLSKAEHIKKFLLLFDEVLKEELGYISTLLNKFNVNFTFDKFKEETVNNLYIYKENLKLAMNLLLDEKFEHINSQIGSDRFPLINFYNDKGSKRNADGIKVSIMECIKEENEDMTENYSYQERQSKCRTDAFDTIKRSHIDGAEYFPESEKTMVTKELKSPRNELYKSRETIFQVKDLKRLNRSSERIGKKEISVPKAKAGRNSKNMIMSVQYLTNSVKQRFKMTPRLRKKEPVPVVIKPAEKH